MLQFVPAILLLLLQGQAGPDRLGSGNGLPATILALSAEIGSAQSSGGQSRSVASLLALSKQNPSLSAVLIGILKSFQESPCLLAEPASDLTLLLLRPERGARPDPPRSSTDRILESASRFRDGPALS